MMETIFQETFPSALETIPEMRDRLVEALLARGCLGAERASCMRLCIEEALANAVRHGNCCNPACKVAIEAFRDNGHCIVRIYDEGPGFDPGACQCSDPERIGGRGAHIMRHYMDDVAYNRALKCLEMTFTYAQPCVGETAHATTE